MRRNSPFLIPLAALLVASGCRKAPVTAETAPATSEVGVRIDAAGITRTGESNFVKGAEGSGLFRELAVSGGNSMRTWTTNGLSGILDEAQSLNLTVSAGIWLEHETKWFSYSNPEHCAKQEERVRKEVLAHRDHPALLVKELDPRHSTYTAVAGASKEKVEGLNAHAPNLDYLGVNTYAGVTSLRKHLETVG